MDHHRFAKFLGFVAEVDNLGIIFEFIEGESLDQKISRGIEIV